MTMRKTLFSGIVTSICLMTIVSGVSAPPLVITEVMPSNEAVLRDEDGDSPDWVEIHNASDRPVSLKGYSLTDDPDNMTKWVFPDRELASGAFVVVFASGKDRRDGEHLHTNFKLGAKGEYLSLVKEKRPIQAFEPTLPKMKPDQSFGVVFKGGKGQFAKSGALLAPTPGAPNSNQWAPPRTKDTKFSVDRGFYDEAINVAITSATPGAEIRYTTDGSTPSADHGEVYDGPVPIVSTTTLRALALAEGHAPSDVDTHSYIFPKNVISQPQRPQGWPRSRPGGRSRGFFGFGGGGSVPLDYAMADPRSFGATEKEVLDALQALPTLSIVTDQGNLFDRRQGIYANPQKRGRDWERPISIELIDPSGNEDGFQIDAGLRIRGGHSRQPYCPKHAFRVYFRDTYGDGRLNYPLFGAEGVDTFDDIDLRTSQNYSYHYSDDGRQMTMVREVFSRDTQRDMGQPYARSRYYHLYLNGLYWGMYQTQEHTEASYAARYLGGEPEDYDTLKAVTGFNRQQDDAVPRGYSIKATDGTYEGWEHLWEQSGKIAAATNAEERRLLYYDLQGLNENGKRDPNKTVYLDADNLIDYMLVTFYTGNFDGPISRFMRNRSTNNWFAVFKRGGNQGFKFFAHDSEHTMGTKDTLHIDRTGPFSAGEYVGISNPQWIHQQLTASEDYRSRFRERAEAALLGNGPLTVEAGIHRINRRARTVGKAIVAECARWGDYKDRPGRTKAEWETAIEYLREVVKERTAILPDQLANALRFENGSARSNLVAAPLFNPVPIPIVHWKSPNKGQAGFQLSKGDQVYYTLDGSDPKGAQGKPSAKALQAKPTRHETVTVLGEVQPVRAMVPQDGSLDQKWTAIEFDDSAWKSGKGGLGYDLRWDYRSLIGVDLTEEMSGESTTAYGRWTFHLKEVPKIDKLILRMKFDDGYVAYLNGQRIAGANAPPRPNWKSAAQGPHDDASAMQWQEENITAQATLLRAGKNVLAVHGMNDDNTSSDMLCYPTIVGTREISGSTITVAKNTAKLSARSLLNGEWSPLVAIPVAATPENKATPATEGNLTLSEIMYHPGDPTEEEAADFDDADAFEYVELMNISEGPIDLAGVAFTNGIDFHFQSEYVLGAGERCVLVKSRGAYQKRYGDQGKVAGNYSGGLKNGGEKLELEDAEGELILSVSYKDSSPWPEGADGLGFSLVLKDPKSDPSLNLAKSWQASSKIGGTPGEGDVITAGGVLVNEILTHTDLPQVDAIELHNPTDEAIDVSGWFLTDDQREPKRYPIVAGTSIAAGGYLVIQGDNDDTPENNDSLPADRFAKSFSLSSHGEEIYLYAANGEGELTGYSHGFRFPAGANGVSFGRHVNSAGKEQFPPQKSITLGKANSGPRRSGVIISEIMYHPFNNDSDAEFVEIWNRGEKAQPLFDPLHPENTWYLEGMKFSFPKGQTLKPNEVAIIARLDEASFRGRYSVPEGVKIFTMEEESALQNSGEKLRLLRPDIPDVVSPDEPPEVPMLEVDHVRYGDRDPWPEEPDGDGVSLERVAEESYSNDPKAWRASHKDGGTPGTPPSAKSAFYDKIDPLDVVPARFLAQTDSASNEDEAGSKTAKDLDLSPWIWLGVFFIGFIALLMVARKFRPE